MKVYLAGNFPQLTKVEAEMVMVDNIKKADSAYHRLVTYFFPKYCNTAFAIKEDIDRGII